MIYRREGMRHQCWSLVIVSTERGRQVGDEVLHHGLPRSRESPVYRRGHGESVFACASTLVRRGEYRAQTGIWRLLGFVSVRTIKGRSIFTVIARVCTRLACTRRHRDRPCLHTPCWHTASPSTSCMHPHKSAPIAALPRRVPRPWNCHPSAVEVILHRPQEPPPPKPLSPRVRDASTVLRARSRSTVLTPSTPMAVSVLHLHQRHARAR